MKKFFTIILAVSMVFTSALLGAGIFADDLQKMGNTAADTGLLMHVYSPKSYVNLAEKQIDTENSKVVPYIKNNRTFVPVRFAAESFGGTAEWDQTAKTAIIRAKEKTVYITVGEQTLRVASNPEEGTSAITQLSEISMDAAAEIHDGRVCIPVRFVAEAVGKQVFYDRGLIVISDTAGSLSAEKDKALIDQLIAKFSGVNMVGSKENLIKLIGFDPEKRPQYVYEYDDEVVNELAPMNLPAAEDASAVAPETLALEKETNFSTTNLQVQGVDEADIIKTDGSYIYYLRKGTIEIVQANADGSLKKVSAVKMDLNFQFSEIFIDTNKIIAVGTSHERPVYETRGFAPDVSVMPSAYQYTKAVVLDTSNKSAPVIERTIQVEGNYLSARKIGQSVYFIATDWIAYGTPILPTYMDSAKSTEFSEIGYDRIGYFPVVANPTLTSIVGFNLDEPETPANIETFLGCGQNIYMSKEALYIAGAGNDYNKGENQTDVYKFAADAGAIVFLKNAAVPGSILNQFSMDEYDGYFRIATNVYDYRDGQQYNNLYVLDGEMRITGSVEKIAPGERIYSTRFMGKRAYMVTFKQVDPLFAIDLADPQNPKIMGALKIPGYSNYLHPYDETHLIGFGKDTTLDQYGNAYYMGMKMSLFDVTDITNPKEMFVETIGTRGTESPLLQDHKALLFSKEKGLVAFPVTVYESDWQVNSGSGHPEYGSFAFAGAYVYDISLTNGFNLRGKVTHLSADDLLKAGSYGSDSNKYIERMLFIGSNLYTASQGMIKANELSTLAEKGSLKFE